MNPNGNRKDLSYRKIIDSIKLPGHISDSDLQSMKDDFQESGAGITSLEKDDKQQTILKPLNLPGYISNSDFQIVKQRSQELNFEWISPLQKCEKPKNPIRIS